MESNFSKYEIGILKVISQDYFKQTGKQFQLVLKDVNESLQFYTKELKEIPEIQYKQVWRTEKNWINDKNFSVKNNFRSNEDEKNSKRKYHLNIRINFLLTELKKLENENFINSLAAENEVKKVLENTKNEKKIHRGKLNEFCEIVKTEYGKNPNNYKDAKDCLSELMKIYYLEKYPDHSVDKVYENYKKI